MSFPAWPGETAVPSRGQGGSCHPAWAEAEPRSQGLSSRVVPRGGLPDPALGASARLLPRKKLQSRPSGCGLWSPQTSEAQSPSSLSHVAGGQSPPGPHSPPGTPPRRRGRRQTAPPKGAQSPVTVGPRQTLNLQFALRVADATWRGFERTVTRTAEQARSAMTGCSSSRAAGHGGPPAARSPPGAGPLCGRRTWRWGWAAALSSGHGKAHGAREEVHTEA